LLAQAWLAKVGKRVAIPEELIADADRELQAPMAPSLALAMIGGADEAPELDRDACWGLDANLRVVAVASPAPLVGQTEVASDGTFTAGTLATVCAYVPFVFAELPVGHALRARAARAYELALARLQNPALLLDLGGYSVTEEQRAGTEALIASLGGEELLKMPESYTGRDVPGMVVVKRTVQHGTPPVTYVHVALKLRPATLDDKAKASVGKLVASLTFYGWNPWRCVERIRGKDFGELVRRIETTPVPAGGWEQNPLASAAKLVEQVAKKLGVSKEAAALYLQYLVLLWPTPKNVQQWNGWKPKQFEVANAELLKEELILEAKRERAQRTCFLPGGWEAHKSPHPPFESWKQPFYGPRDAQGNVQPHLARFAALAPFHLMFQRAWQRIEAGDVPKYEEVKR
jgi:hypothetical protein